MKRQIKNFFKRSLVRLFHVAQKLGVDILPRHFYSEIPVIYRMREEVIWRQPYSLAGIDTNTDEQLQFVREIVTPALGEHLRQSDVYGAACSANGEAGYGPIEAQFLYAFVRSRRPKRIVQVGCGVSTALCLAAVADENYDPAITCVEPYPSPFLVKAAQEGRIHLIEKKVECLTPDFISELSAEDLLFVDSTHTLGPAGEVTRIILEVLPRLNDGVYVHFHDIWLPYDFEPTILDKALFFWHETALLHAFLCFNSRFRMRASLSQLHHDRIQDFAPLFAGYEPMQFDRGIAISEGHYPSSIFLQVIPQSGAIGSGSALSQSIR